MSKKIKVTIAVLSVLLSVGVLALAGILLYNYFNPLDPQAAIVTDNVISPEPKGSEAVPVNVPAEAVSASLSLSNKNEGDNTPFEVGNMFPGDTFTNYYRVQVSHKGDVTVRYHIDIKNNYNKLGEVMQCRIVLVTTGETLYDGLVKDMPMSLNKTITASKPTVSELYYEVTTYLDTSVGNEYQSAEGFSADLRWWVEETGQLDKPPKTGEADFFMAIIAVALLSFLLIIILLYKKKRKEADENEG